MYLIWRHSLKGKHCWPNSNTWIRGERTGILVILFPCCSFFYESIFNWAIRGPVEEKQSWRMPTTSSEKFIWARNFMWFNCSSFARDFISRVVNIDIVNLIWLRLNLHVDVRLLKKSRLVVPLFLLLRFLLWWKQKSPSSSVNNELTWCWCNFLGSK